MLFSIIVVALNPGKKWKATLDSVFCQTWEDYEIILKDGGSTDGSLDVWRSAQEADEPGAGKASQKAEKAEKHRAARNRVRYINSKDSGIYDAMNQAVSLASGQFLLFLNCGDLLADERVLERTAAAVRQQEAAGTDPDRLILYGDTWSEKNRAAIASAPAITGFTCYRNIPCHQSCFYGAALCREKPYDLQYKIRADYDHFLWCFYRGGAEFLHMDFPVSSYEGGGYSESRANVELDRREHGQITSAYMSRGELFRYKAQMALTLAPLRRALADSRAFTGIYHRIKMWVYRRP